MSSVQKLDVSVLFASSLRKLCFRETFFYPTLTLKTAAFVTCWTLKKWRNARPYSKSTKKSEEMRCKSRKKRTLLGRLWLFGKGKNCLLFGRLWNAVITSRQKMEMKHNDKCTLVQRQRYPLPFRSLQYWPMNYCVRNTTAFQLQRTSITFNTVYYDDTRMYAKNRSISKYIINNQCLMWGCFFSQLSFVSLSSQIMPHFVTVGGLRHPNPPPRLRPWAHRGSAPDPSASLHLYSRPRPAHHRMPAIITVTQAANFHVLIG